MLLMRFKQKGHSMYLDCLVYTTPHRCDVLHNKCFAEAVNLKMHDFLH